MPDRSPHAAQRVVLITGTGTDGIAAAAVTRMMAPGIAFALHYHGEGTKADALRARLHAAGAEASLHAADFAEPASARALVAAAVAAHGRIDALVHCAAATVRKPVMETKAADLARLLDINVRSTFELLQATAEHMLARQAAGRIVVVSSVNQQLVVAGQAAYCTTKGAVMQLAKSFALELAPHGITVNLVAPGTVETDLNRHLLVEPAFRALREAPIPMKRVAQPSEIAGAIAFLASEEAGYVTGTAVTVDGGLSLS